MIRRIKEVGVRHKVIIIITHSDTEIEKKRRNNKVIFDRDRYGKYNEAYSATQNTVKNVVVHSKSY